MRAPADTPGASLLRHLRARDPQPAARSAALILLLAAVALAGSTLLGQATQSGAVRAVSWTAAGLLAVLSAVHRLVPAERLDRMAAGALMSVGGVLLGAGISMLTGDSSAAAQSFLSLPVLWAASHPRTAGLVAVTGTTVVIDTVTLLHLPPVREALTDPVLVAAC